MEKVTLDMLAGMIASGFEEVKQRLDGHDQRFNTLETGLSAVRQDIRELREEVVRFDRRNTVHEEDLTDLTHRMEQVEKKLGIA